MKRLIVFATLVILVGCSQRESDPVNRSESQSYSEKKTVLLFVKIPDPVMPIERGEKYEDPLNEFLVAKSLGEVTGGGSQLSQPNDAGQRSIKWVGVDVEVYDPEHALPFVVEKLKELGVPEGTEIEQYKPVMRIIKVK